MNNIIIWNDFIKEYTDKAKQKNSISNLTKPKNVTLHNGNNITLRLEAEKDYREVELLTREAFWSQDNMEKLGDIGADEHYLVHLLRGSPEFVPELDFVAECCGKIIGNVMYSLAYVLTKEGVIHPVLTFGPLSVLPDYKKQGVGSAIMRHTLKIAARLGYGSVLLFGHPEYYPRFGFRKAKEFGITTAAGESNPAFMAMELLYGDLEGITGSFHISPVFTIDAQRAREYDRCFPPIK